MPFPKSPRVVYEKNPLQQVICQLKFPPILRIESESPADFQERVRGSYPLFQKRSEILLGPQVPEDVAKVLVAGLPGGMGSTRYLFTTEDEVWTASLARDFLALETKKYERWEEFEDRLRAPLDALLAVYAPTFFSRVGLRYVDLIRRSILGLGDSDWSKLLQQHVLGELASPLAGDIEHAYRETSIRLDDRGSKVTVRHGLCRVDNAEELCYFVDSDFFTEKRTETKNGSAVLKEFNQHAGRLFRWCITERLHEAMRPQPLA
jgi:uncharacterized protein (TIGR04255 family)